MNTSWPGLVSGRPSIKHSSGEASGRWTACDVEPEEDQPEDLSLFGAAGALEAGLSFVCLSDLDLALLSAPAGRFSAPLSSLEEHAAVHTLLLAP